MLFSCKKELSISFSETNLTSKNNSIVEVNIPLVIENSDIAMSINSAIENYVITALQIGESNSSATKSIEESIEIFNTEYTNFINDFPESKQKWEAQIDGEVMFKSQELISVAITSYTDTGAAHGVLNISFLNFETKTGKIINSSKLIKNVDAFKKIAKPYFDEALTDKDISFDTKTFELPPNIAYTEEGVVLLFNVFQIAPYSTEIIEFTIPIEEAKPYLAFNSF